MMAVMKRSALFLGLASALFALAPQISLAAFGVSPPVFNATHLVAGASYTQTIYLLQDNPSVDLTVNATLNVPDHIKSWISIDKGTQFVIPAGIQQFPVNITITVPQGESIGSYQGNVLFATAPGNSGQVTIALGADVIMNIVVGTGIYEQYSIPYITIPSIEEGWAPRVTYRLQNNGNIPEQLTGATLSIFDQYDVTQLAYLTTNSGFPEVPPFASKEDTVQFPTDLHLGIGDYWGVVSFFKNDQQIASQKVLFHVLPPGSLSSPIDIIIANIQANWIYYLVVLLALILVSRRVFVMRRKKRS